MIPGLPELLWFPPDGKMGYEAGRVLIRISNGMSMGFFLSLWLYEGGMLQITMRRAFMGSGKFVQY